MATGYYQRLVDTVVSGSSLQSNLSGADIRNLEFSAAMSSPPTLAISGNTSLSPEQLIQACIGTQLIDCAAAGGINLGTDSASQAAAYVQLFNLRSTNDVRLLRFANTSLAFDCNLLNSSGTSVSVQVRQLDADGLSAAADTQILFDVSVAPSSINGSGDLNSTQAGMGAGIQRLVRVRGTTLTSGSQVVEFAVMGESL